MRRPCAIVRQSVHARRNKVATRTGLAQQDGGSKVEANTICYSAEVSAFEESHEWRLALGLLSRMAEAKWKRTPFVIVRQSVPARRATNGTEKLHREGGCPGLASVRRLGAFDPVDAPPLWLVHTSSFRLMLALFGLCAHRPRLNPQGGSWMVWGPSPVGARP